MSNMEIKTAIVNEYRWLYRIAVNNEDWFMAEYYEQLIKEGTEAK